MNVFLDCEFTGLTKDASLISLALYASEQEYFYAEFNEVDEALLSDWMIENVMDKLEFKDQDQFIDNKSGRVKIKGNRQAIVQELKSWLSRFEPIEIWGDVPHYDWVLFCDLFGGALKMPGNLHYICRDIATLLLAKNVDIDIKRAEFVRDEIAVKSNQHNALFDAKVAKLCYDKLLKFEMAEEKTISKHIFLFPFRWDYKAANTQFENRNLIERTNIAAFLRFINETNWIKSNYYFNDPLEYYNDATYFYEYVRTAIYQSNSEKNTVYNYQYDLKNLKTTYEIIVGSGSAEGNYSLDVTKIMLNVYETGVGILSFHLSNVHHHNKEDILRINDFGRRIYPQFLDTSSTGAGEPKELISATQKAFLAKEIKITNEEGNIFQEDFSHFFITEEVIKCIRDRPTKLPNAPIKIAKFLSKNFTTINYLDNTEQVVIRPILDDRMFVICWYGNNEEIAKLKYDELREEYQYLAHEKNDFWTQYIFIDNSGNTLQSKNLRRTLAKRHTYDRWIDYETLYGISRYSVVALTGRNDFSINYLSRHVVGRYFELTQLALAQRASVIKFSDEATSIAGAADSMLIDESEFLHKAYMQFINRMNFSEITAQEQGIEMYQMLIDSMEINKEINNLNREIDELHQFVNIKEQITMTKEVHSQTNESIKLANAANNFSLIATIFLPATFFATLFAIYDDEKFSFDNIDIQKTIIMIMITVLTLMSFIFFGGTINTVKRLLRKLKHNKEYIENH